MEKFRENQPTDTIVCTKANTYEYNVKWIFKGFSKFLSISNSTGCVGTKYFYPEPNIWWQVKTRMEDPKWIICVYRSDLGKFVELQWKITISEESKKVLFEKSLKNVFDETTEHLFFSMDESVLEEINLLKTSDTVIMTICLKISEMETRTLFESPSDAQFSKDVQEFFSKELVKMYDNQVGTDITFKVQEETVGAHKAILSAISPVFARMFQQEMAESENKVVDIPGIKMSTFKELLAFIYSRVRLDYDFETSLDVYYAADEYEMPKLREVCSLILNRKLNSENVIQVLQLADLHNDAILKDKSLQFLRLYFTKCVKSENWIQFQTERSELYEEVLNYIND